MWHSDGPTCPAEVVKKWDPPRSNKWKGAVTQEPSNINEIASPPEEALDGSSPPAVLNYAVRLLRHVEKMDAARTELKAATRAYKKKSTPGHRRRAEAALVAHVKAEHRLRRSAMRMREAIEAASAERPVS